MAATIFSVPHVRLLEKKLTAAIRKVLGLPKSTSLTYLIMPEDQLGLGVCSLEARYYFLTTWSALARCAMRPHDISPPVLNPWSQSHPRAPAS